MKNPHIQEIISLIIALLIGVISVLISKFKLSRKNNKMLKIVDALIMIAEETGVTGTEKKNFVVKAFEDFKLGKIDNIEEYIDDKIKLSNTINIKKSVINQVISEELEEQRYYQNIEDGNINVDKLEERNMVQLEQENDRIKEENLILEKEVNKLQVELVESNRDITRLKEVEQHLAIKVNLNNTKIRELEELCEHLRDKVANTTNMLKMREDQLNKLKGDN